MKKALFNITIFMMLLYFFNGYINYFQFEFMIPGDLFRYPPSVMSEREVNLWRFFLTWVIPGCIVFCFMILSKLTEKIPFTWGVTCVGLGVLIHFIYALGKPLLLFLAAQVQGGGAMFVAGIYLNKFQQFSSIPMGVLLLCGTLKVFYSINSNNYESTLE